MDNAEIRARLDQMVRQLVAQGLDAYVQDWERFSEAAQNTPFRLFDPFAWSGSRRQDEDEF